MPHVTLPITSEGHELSVLIGLDGRSTTALVAAGTPVPRPLLVRGILDSGSSITTVNRQVIQALGLPLFAQHSTQTVAGTVAVNLYDASLSIPPMGRLTASLLVLSDLLVMEPMHPLVGIDVLVGRDVLAHLLSIMDGPQAAFTLAD
jgi:hypothetical protein